MAAQAAPMETGHAKMNSVDLNALATQAREALSNSPVVSVAPDAELNVEKSAVSVVSAAENEEYQAELAANEAEEAAEAAAAEAEAAEAAAATASTASSVDVPASAIGNSVISIASRYIGVPYVSGGGSPSGFDCSGFTSYVFGQLGISLPHSSSSQPGYGTRAGVRGSARRPDVDPRARLDLRRWQHDDRRVQAGHRRRLPHHLAVEPHVHPPGLIPAT